MTHPYPVWTYTLTRMESHQLRHRIIVGSEHRCICCKLGGQFHMLMWDFCCYFDLYGRCFYQNMILIYFYLHKRCHIFLRVFTWLISGGWSARLVYETLAAMALVLLLSMRPSNCLARPRNLEQLRHTHAHRLQGEWEHSTKQPHTYTAILEKHSYC